MTRSAHVTRSAPVTRSGPVVVGIAVGRVYKVDDRRRIQTVELCNGTCTCRKWQVSGLPYGHVLAICRVIGLTDCNRLAKEWFMRISLKGTYQELVYSVGEVSSRQIPNYSPVVKTPHMNKKPSGRPKSTKRIRSQVLGQKFEKAEQEKDDLKLKLEKFQTSLKNLSQLLASQTNDKTRLGYNNQVFTSFMFDCDEMFSSETDESLLVSPIYDRYQSGEGYHVVPPPYTGTFMPPKPDLVIHNAPNFNETIHTAFNVELSLTTPDKDLCHTHRPSVPIIEDWVSDSEDDFEAELSQNVPSFVQPTEQVKIPWPFVKPVENSILAANPKTDIPKPQAHGNSRNRKACFVYQLLLLSTTHVTRPRPAETVVTKSHSPPRRNINRILSPKPSNFPLKVTSVKVPRVNAVKGVQGK
uniref:Putative Gag-Pol polyprotein n=1 Tax=Tanacetum cinerariifolium TaxID=118510 RepID=A0A6L2LK47_TANCI|nr:putative Gag-Pol polyprotein [Tanacetum cinerariifolium]